MKYLSIVFCICLQVFVASTTQAGSSLDAYRPGSEALFRCLWAVAGDEDTQQEQKKDETEEGEEEEPDCD